MSFQLFHASPSRFDRPDFEAALGVLAEQPTQRNPKGAIGLWCAPFVCDGFGPETASIRLADDTRYVSLPIRCLRDLYDALGDSELDQAGLVQAFVNLREALSPQADVLLIDDSSDRLGEVVILNLDVIEDWTWHLTSELLAAGRIPRLPAYSDIDINASLSSEIASWSFAADGTVKKPKSPSP